MASRRTLITLAVVAGFVALLLYGTLGAQQVECSVTVTHEGRENSATASAANEEEAERSARMTACGPIAPGMDASIQCTNRPPVKRQCRQL